MIRIKKGLDIPISGSPEDKISDSKKPRAVGLIGSDYHGMKPAMLVKEGDRVKIGQPLFEDKKNPGVVFTSPGGGVIQSINRGARRALQSVVVDIDDKEEDYWLEENRTTPHERDAGELINLSSEEIRKHLVNSGLWTSFRTRPFSKIPPINSNPSCIFVNAMDTNPLSFNPNIVISEENSDFKAGLMVLNAFLYAGNGSFYDKNETKNKIHLCASFDFEDKFPFIGKPLEDISTIHLFSGPHPSGLSGTHMHFISPPSLTNINWHLNYSDVINIGYFFSSGLLPKHKYIALSGPQILRPRIIKTRIGACSDEICAGELKHSENRIISGSVINGREAIGPYAYLGRYHNQICAVEEPNSSDRELFDWALLGSNRFSKLSIFISSIYKNKKFDIKARMYGPDRAILPIGVYEEVFPLKLLITPLLRGLAVGDTQELQSLGVLELDEEDLALCSFVCPSKYDFGYLLRERLTTIEAEG